MRWSKLYKKVNTYKNANCESSYSEWTIKKTRSSCSSTGQSLIIKWLIIFAFTIRIVHSIFCIPDLLAVHLTSIVRFIPFETRTALAFIYFSKWINLRVCYFATLNFTTIITFWPYKISNTWTRYEGRVCSSNSILNSSTIFRALLDFIYPYIVDRAHACVVYLSWRIWKWNGFAIHHTAAAVSYAEPISMLTANTAIMGGILLNSISYHRTVPLANGLLIFNSKIVSLIAQASLLAFCFSNNIIY